MDGAILLLSSLLIVCLYTRGAQVFFFFQKHRRHLKILGAIRVSWSKVITEGLPTLGVNVKSFPPHCDQTAALCTSLFSTKASEFNPVCPEETIIGYQCKETTRSVSYVQYHTADSVEPTGTSVMDQSLSLPFFF